MGEYSTKAFFKAKLKDNYDEDYAYFEVDPAPDTCPVCESKANKKIAISTATSEDYPPFHRECRCNIRILGNNEKASSFERQKTRYETGEFPMKRCPHCKEWTAGNSTVCDKCGEQQ